MNWRIALQFAALAVGVGLADLAGADGLGIGVATPPYPNVRQTAEVNALSQGEGGKSELSHPAAELDSWKAAFIARLDESIAESRRTAELQKQRPLTITWSSAFHPESELQASPIQGDVGKTDRSSTLATILRAGGLPASLVGVAAVESGFDPLALSPQRARGLWQLMPETARRYGLIVRPERDERTDPFKSTVAAAAYMKDLFAQFQDWPLALAAYNAGEGRVARAMTRAGARDFWTLRRRGALPEETLRYVPAVLAKFEATIPQRPAPSASVATSALRDSRPSRIMYATPTMPTTIPGTL